MSRRVTPYHYESMKEGYLFTKRIIFKCHIPHDIYYGRPNVLAIFTPIL